MNSITPCPDFEPELSAYLDDELPAEARAHLDAHLSHCRPCTDALARLRGTTKLLRRWDAHETAHAPSTGFRNRVVAHATGGAAGETPAPATADAPRGALARIHPLFAAAAAASITAAVGWLAFAPESAPPRQFAALESQVDRLRAEMDARNAASGVLPAPEARPPLDVPRLGEFDSVVGTEPVLSSAPSPQPFYERVDEGMLLEDARGAFDAYASEQSRLQQNERIAEIARNQSRTASKQTPTAVAVPPVAAFLATLRVPDARAEELDHVRVWPIETSASVKPAARPLSIVEAFERRLLTLRAETDGDVVATTKEDRGGQSVLVLAGDVLKGGGRDRVVRDDVLLARGRTLQLPTFASGREHPRTSYRSFLSSPLVAPVGVRALFASGTTTAPVVQREVDAAVAGAVFDFGSNGGQGSLVNLGENYELFREMTRDVEAFRKKLDGKNVVGFAMSAGPRLLAVETCGDPETFRMLRDRALYSHLLTARAMLDGSLQGPAPSEASVLALIGQARGAAYDDAGAAGDGSLSSFRTAGGDVFGYGLLDGTRVVHAVVFAGIPGGSGTSSSGRGAGRPDAGIPVGGGGDAGSKPEPRGDGGSGGGLDSK